MAKKPQVGGSIEDRDHLEPGNPGLANANVTFIYGSDLRKRQVADVSARPRFTASDVRIQMAYGKFLIYLESTRWIGKAG
ncbi:hypothetical protein LDL08_42040 [Nonomuraea glycinis]|nr:hypothetical protein [Nonomuraea glycinis]MCA2182766.1 hypothetical protein [Nonomuraea glycinis]